MAGYVLLCGTIAAYPLCSIPCRPNTYTASLDPSCLPNSLDSLRHANIIRLKLVQSNTNQDRRCPQSPPHKHSCLRQSFPGNVIDDDRFETNVRVDEDGTAKDSIHCGIQRPGCEWCNCEGDETGGDQTFECPVVRAV